MGLNSLFMSAQHLAGQAGQFEPQRANNILLFIEGLETYGISNISGDNLLTLSLESFPFPAQRNDPIEMPFQNQVVKVAGQAQTDEFEVVYRDFVDVNARLVLENWRLAVYDPQTGRIGRAAQYKKNATVELSAPGGDVLRKYRVEGLWPSFVGGGDADQTSNEPAKLTVTYQFDRVYPIEAGWAGPVRRILAEIIAAF